MRKEIKGVGMMAKEWSVPDTPAEKKAARRAAEEAWRVAGNSFEIQVASIEEWARAKLAALGFKDGDDSRFGGDSIDDRAGDYALRVLNYIKIVRKAIADNNAQEAARFGVLIGMAFKEIHDAIEWEHSALVGVSAAKTARDNASTKTENMQSNIRQAAHWYKYFRNLRPNQLADVIYQQVRNKLNVSQRTLDTYLAEARKLDLIPKLHRRTPPR